MTHLKVGDKAPDFCIQNEDGILCKLSDYKSKKLVLYFYPKDNTPGCTAQSCNLRDNYLKLKEKGLEVLGVSADDQQSHQKFIGKFDLPFSLLADIEKTVINAYGVWGPKKFMGKEYEGIHRTTFLINEDGVIDYIFNKVKTKEHSEQILEIYK